MTVDGKDKLVCFFLSVVGVNQKLLINETFLIMKYHKLKFETNKNNLNTSLLLQIT